MELILVLAGSALLLSVSALYLRKRLPRRLTPAEAGPAGQLVSVVIPARDEEEDLPGLLQSLNEQRDVRLELIVADDGSVDRTSSVARSLGARVVTVPPRPPGWNGKTWACHTGAQASAGQLLVFLDADTRLERGGLASVLGQLNSRPGLISVEPEHRPRRVHEQLSALFNIVRLAAVGGGSGPPAGAFGPCLAIRRADYDAHGGHAHPRVRGQVLEHFVMGQLVAGAGGSVRSFRGRGVLWFRMYPHGLGQLVNGWAKALLDGAQGTPRMARMAINAWVTGAALSVAALAAALLAPGPWWIAGAAAYGFNAALTWLLLRQTGRFAWWVAPLFFVPLFAFFFIAAWAAVRAALGLEVRWRGRIITRSEEV